MNTLECRKTHVIACDLDDSLVATQSHSEQERQTSDDALRLIGALVTAVRVQHEHMQDGREVYFGSSTGRTFGSIQELAAKRPAFGEIFQMMDFHIASVGTAVYTRNESTSDFTRNTNWPNTNSWDRRAITNRLVVYPDLTPQEFAAQDSHKISYTSTSAVENSVHASQLHSYLDDEGLQANVVASGSGLWRFVDILPVGVDKGAALLQLPGLLKDSNGRAESSVCRIAVGDSLNDRAALEAADVAIIPSNGQPDLLNWAAENQSVGSLYIADERFAAGVLQGLQQHLYPQFGQ